MSATKPIDPDRRLRVTSTLVVGREGLWPAPVDRTASPYYFTSDTPLLISLESKD